jgi:hypothetical protein
MWDRILSEIFLPLCFLWVKPDNTLWSLTVFLAVYSNYSLTLISDQGKWIDYDYGSKLMILTFSTGLLVEGLKFVFIIHHLPQFLCVHWFFTNLKRDEVCKKHLYIFMWLYFLWPNPTSCFLPELEKVLKHCMPHWFHLHMAWFIWLVDISAWMLIIWHTNFKFWL